MENQKDINISLDDLIIVLKSSPRLNSHIRSEIFKLVESKINWELLSEKFNPSEEFLTRFKSKLNINSIVRRRFNCQKCYRRLCNGCLPLSERFIKCNLNELSWDGISCQQLTDEFIITFKDKIDWSTLNGHGRPLSKELLNKCEDAINWSSLDYGLISESSIEEYSSRVDWDQLCRCNRTCMSIEFMRRIAHHLNDCRWVTLSAHWRMSDDILIEFRDKIDWENYCKFFDIHLTVVIKLMELGIRLPSSLDICKCSRRSYEL